MNTWKAESVRTNLLKLIQGLNLPVLVKVFLDTQLKAASAEQISGGLHAMRELLPQIEKFLNENSIE
jgi:hypothetical protein